MIEEKVREALDAIRPNFQADGGDVDLVDVTLPIVSQNVSGTQNGTSSGDLGKYEEETKKPKHSAEPRSQ